jgi:hypothetical protein
MYSIGPVPSGRHDVVASHYEEAIDLARRLAVNQKVGAWYTCDHIHFLRIA